MDFLTATLERKRREVEEWRRVAPEAELRAVAGDLRPARAWRGALDDAWVRVIAEIKRTSPAAGRLAAVDAAADRAREYERAGAAAVSVLTDRAFDGRLADLEAVAAAVGIPVLRKDFLIDPYQVWESRAGGADAVLAIVTLLEQEELEAVVGTAREAGLGVLVEVHDEAEIDRALALVPDVIGVNARDLRTLEVDQARARGTLAKLASVAPEVLAVAESGIRTAADVAEAAAAGAAAILVGEALMTSADPGATLASLASTPRRREVTR